MTWSRRERVIAALDGEPVDRLPLGEIGLGDGLVRAAVGLPEGQPVPWAARRAVLDRLGHDVVTVDLDAAAPEEGLFWIGQWRREDDRFVVARLQGLWATSSRVPGLRSARSFREEVYADITLELERTMSLAASAGADAVLLDDAIPGLADCPWLRELYVPLLTLLIRSAHQHGIFCFLRVAREVPALLSEVTVTGLDGLQGLCVGDHIGLADVSRILDRPFCVWGGIDSSWLRMPGSERWVVDAVGQWLRAHGEVAVILGTRDGLGDEIALADLMALEAIEAAILALHAESSAS